MSNLSKTKKEAYTKILKEKYADLSDEKLNEIINYLYELANLEFTILNKQS